MTNLLQQPVGRNYGGWFGMYPVEDLRARISRSMGGTRWDEITALTIFYPFDIPFPFLRVDLRCPVTVLVTDPLGRRTGCQTNGTTLEEIPDSWFSYATAAKSQSTTILNLIPLPNES